MKLRISKSTEILLWVYGVGLAGMLLPFSRGFFTAITPLNLLFALFFLFWGRWPERRVIITGTVIAVVSFLIEAAGVNTGRIFGVYIYGNTLGPKLLNTPIIIGLNWFLLVYCTNAVGRQLWGRLARQPGGRQYDIKRSLFIIITGSALMVLYDLLLEPAAVRLDMWSWECGIFPVRNYIAWFLFSLMFHIYTRYREEEEVNPRAPILFTVQLGFFALIDLFYSVAS